MSNKPVLIGVSGRAGSGKDPAAQVLAGHMDGPTTIIPLATGLKQMLAAHYGLAWGGTRAQNLLYTGPGKAQPSPNPLKPGNTVRQDLIDLGDVTRSLDPDVWVRDTIRRAQESGARYVILPDVRYPNELQALDYGIWVGPDDVGDHPTESALTSADFPASARYMQSTVEGRLHAIRGAFSTRREDWDPTWQEVWITTGHKHRLEREKQEAKDRERAERLSYLLQTKPTVVECGNREFEVRYEKSEDDTQAFIYEQDKLAATAGVLYALVEDTSVELSDPDLFTRPVALVRELYPRLPRARAEAHGGAPEPRFEDQAQVDAVLPPMPYPFGPWQDLSGTRPWTDTGNRLSDGHTATLYWYGTSQTHQLRMESGDQDTEFADLMGGDQDPGNWALSQLGLYLIKHNARVLPKKEDRAESRRPWELAPPLVRERTWAEEFGFTHQNIDDLPREVRPVNKPCNPEPK